MPSEHVEFSSSVEFSNTPSSPLLPYSSQKQREERVSLFAKAWSLEGFKPPSPRGRRVAVRVMCLPLAAIHSLFILSTNMCYLNCCAEPSVKEYDILHPDLLGCVELKPLTVKRARAGVDEISDSEWVGEVSQEGTVFSQIIPSPYSFLYLLSFPH